jgi:hypothetical protein
MQLHSQEMFMEACMYLRILHMECVYLAKLWFGTYKQAS